MATDADMLRLLVAAELAGAKAVMVGDHRQLGSVGPGGSLQALFARHRPAVHILKENVRQEDPGERAALAHLRAGDVARAVAWYAEHDRIVTAPTRDEALDRVVDAWAADIETGKHAAVDRIVVLAPGDNGQLVTSERGQVAAADPTTGALTARMDGRSLPDHRPPSDRR
jgi:ATP-dependent exoDNAse (exonuclease V) alpha subunit